FLKSAGMSQPAGQRPPPRSRAADQLTRREKAVLVLIAEGLTSTQIAQRMHLSPGTIGSHRRNLMAKLDLHSSAEVTRFALEHGLLSD
ncbi:MAG: response regulator transcription factor, partial [Betaproteobacteria bacterium]|nr:response regulator transcription factor [Betaproteobacteria bacterium]